MRPRGSRGAALAKTSTRPYDGPLRRPGLRFRSIRSKLLLSFVAVILLPLLTLGVLGPIISAHTLENEATGHTWQLIRQVARNIEFYVRQTESIVQVVDANPDVKAFLEFSGSDRTFSPRAQQSTLQLLRQSPTRIQKSPAS